MAEKKRTEVDWQDVRVFLALGRHGSLSAAARALGVNHATISRRIQSLEATLGEKLAERRPEGYVLTPAGTRALSVASDMETAVHTLGRGGTDDAPKGIVRVNAPPALSQAFLTRRLAEVPILFPGLDIDLATDLRSISLERHEADIAVRIDKPEDGDFIAKPVGSIDFGFYGTPAVCERVEGGEAPILVGFDEANSHMPDASWLGQHYPQTRIAFRANNHVAQATAACAGVGLAMLPHYVGRQLPELRACALSPVRPSRDIWLLIRRQDRKDLPIRTVVDYLTRRFEEARDLFEA
ncbi:LysR family transcriptional regulator [Burkholderia gladioli]|uniref:LysR family transcriptional regulator n=1 Tax=Burkholderia gladioli TaxID=28095 RepID=UPI001640542A|nr:LysR family transcriptional regulator [Burkholderia gladioli]MBU9180394.1 LysR family transcriptional regulator [Burkholderia gladioli]